MSTGGALTSVGAYLRAWAQPSEARAVVMLRNRLGGDGGGEAGGGVESDNAGGGDAARSAAAAAAGMGYDALMVGFEHEPDGRQWTAGYGDDFRGWLGHLPSCSMSYAVRPDLQLYTAGLG